MPRNNRLDKTTVIQAAVVLVNHEGPQALTLARLAKELDIQTPSLYNHINGLPGLLRELALKNALALGDCLLKAAMAKSGTEAVIEVAQAYRTYIKDNPGLYMLSLRASRTETPIDIDLKDAEDRVVEIALAVMSSFGLRGEYGLHAVRGLRSLVHGFTTLELAGGFGLPLDCEESFQLLLDWFIKGLLPTTARS